MKARSILMALAGLGLFACTNEDLNQGGVNGEATVSVKIAEPAISRAINAGNYTDGPTIAVELNTITLRLTAQTGGGEVEFTLAAANGNRAKLLENVMGYQFTGVRNPSKMEVFINTDKSSGWTLAEVVGAGLAEPLYAESSNFQSKGDIDEDGITEYEVSLEPAHTVARLEFGGIEHIHSMVGNPAAEKPCMFATINIDGVFLNNVAGTTPATDWATAQNIPLHSVIGTSDAPVPFAENQIWPANDQCYAYNILPVTEGKLPILTVCFSGITIDNTIEQYKGMVWGNPQGLGYATVKNYILDDAFASAHGEAFGIDENNVISKFPAGYIYQVKSLEIPDEAIGSTITGAEDVHVYAVVTVSSWNVVTGSVEWN